MNGGRRAKGFAPLGALGASDLGLPRRQAHRLLLADTWRRVAGGPVARRLSVVRVTRGTVEILADPSWADDLGDILPLLVSRLAQSAPNLGIRRFRLRIHGRGADDGARSIAIDPRPLNGAPER